MNDKINTLIMKYREKTGDFFTPKIFVFENNQLNPFLTIEQSKLYMNCKVKVISQEDGNHWSNIWVNKNSYNLIKKMKYYS